MFNARHCMSHSTRLFAVTAVNSSHVLQADPRNLSVEASLLLSTSQEGPTQGSEQTRHVLSEPLLGHRQSQSHNAARQRKQTGVGAFPGNCGLFNCDLM